MYEQQSLLTADLDEIIDATGHNDAQPQEQAQKAPAVKYYPIDEETARRAHEMMSMRDYPAGRATNEYRASVDKAAALVERCKAATNPYYHGKLDALLDRSAPARQRDGGYMAAVYILSADKTLCDIARRKICPDGISFPGILSVARRAELSDSQFTAIRSAHNLFNGGSSSSVTPYDLALCDYLTLDIITQAMYIWKCGCTISAGQDGSIQLDRTGECQRRGIEQALFQHLSEFE